MVRSLEALAMEIPELPLMEDIWGRILLDAWRGGEGTYTIRRDDGYMDGLCVLEMEMAQEIRRDHEEALAHVWGRVLDRGPNEQLRGHADDILSRAVVRGLPATRPAVAPHRPAGGRHGSM